jgi:cytochrome c-type biogenesis protein CcmF
VDIRSTLKEDLYAILAGFDLEESTVTIKLLINPLIAWIWIGGVVLAVGTLLVMLPDRRERKKLRIRYVQEALKQ